MTSLLKNKKGIITTDVFAMVILALVLVILLAFFLYFYSEVDKALSGNIMAGQVNLSNESANTIGKINAGFSANADLIGIMFLFGMVIAIMFSGFLTRGSSPTLFFVIEFIILIFAYIISVYISNSYEIILNLLPFKSLVTANLPQTTRFILLLPKITLITGAIALIVTYAGIPRTKEEEVAGF